MPLDAAALRRWCLTGAAALEAAREAIDGLNVFPVADADTGTNLALTFRAVADAAAEAPADSGLARVVARLARAALTEARGNSGVILSQLLVGGGEVLAEYDECDGPGLARALRRGADTARAAVTHPAEGTILTVAAASATGAEAAAAAGGDVGGVAAAAAEAAAVALRATPAQLATLRDAGVVDAGGLGLLVLLDALAGELTGEPAPDQLAEFAPARVARSAAARSAAGPAYEVMYLLSADESALDALRTALEPLGDSLLVVGGGGLWNVHVHVDDVGAAIEAGVEAGRPHRIRVTRFADQVGGAAEVEARSGRAVVALAPGEGLRALLEAEGAVVLDGIPTAVPDPAAVLAAVDATRAAEVVLLPNDLDAHDAVRQGGELARRLGITVAVVPTRSSLQALAALAVRDERRSFADEVIAMSAAAAATRFGEVTVAAERALTSAGVCEPGDVLGLVDGDVAVIGEDVFAVGAAVLDRLLIGGGELATLVTGDGSDADLGERLASYLRLTRPTVEPVLLSGGQSDFPLLIGVE